MKNKPDKKYVRILYQEAKPTAEYIRKSPLWRMKMSSKIRLLTKKQMEKELKTNK